MLKIRLIFGVILTVSTLKLEAQNLFSRSGKAIDFSVYKTTDTEITIHDILNNEYHFKSPNDFNKKTHPKDIYWIKIDLINDLKTIKSDSLWYLSLNRFEYGTIYQSKKGFIFSEAFGWFENLSKKRSILHTQGVPFKSNSLFQNRYIYLKVKRVTNIEHPNTWHFSYRSQYKEDLIKYFYTHKDLNTVIPIYIFVGVCLIMFLFTIMYFIYSKRLEFLFYSIYILFLFLYLLEEILKLNNLFFGNFNLTSYTFFQQTQLVINLSYILFVIYYLNTKEVYPKLHAVLKIIPYFLISIITIDIIFLVSTNFIGHIHLLNFERLIMTLFGLGGMIYLLIKGKNKLAYFIVIGSFFYTIGALGFLFIDDIIYMVAGSSLEIIIFSMGLTYKIQQEYNDKLKYQKEALLNRTKALRAQINPHFIFNSLSSIQSFITKNNKISALKYLSKFSRLTRNILESSIETNVVLEDEIKMLNDYLELESLRFDKAFNYKINVDKELDTNAIEVPFMILQPFVENAIIHGLLPKKGGIKQLTVNFSNNNDFVVCEIDDNGIGRAAAKQKSYIHKKDKKSRGIAVTMQRLQAINLTDEKTIFEIIDKVDNENNALGTKVIIKIPV